MGLSAPPSISRGRRMAGGAVASGLLGARGQGAAVCAALAFAMLMLEAGWGGVACMGAVASALAEAGRAYTRCDAQTNQLGE